ncbi:MAG: hypothetical protein H0U18_16915 [Pyrinomonadaceae bacterium]|nr:hypothetical protein [Pyrinomonadaceae bacterium]
MDLTSLSATTYLSIFGVVVLFICIALIFTERATPLKTPQRIKGFGVELEISVLTLLVLVGLILSLSSIYIQVTGYQQQLISSQKQLDTLDREVASARRQLEAAKKIDLTVFVNLEGVNNLAHNFGRLCVMCVHHVDRTLLMDSVSVCEFQGGSRQ